MPKNTAWSARPSGPRKTPRRSTKRPCSCSMSTRRSAGRSFGASGVPSLRDLVLDAAGAIIDPRTGKSLRAAWTEAHRAAWAAGAPWSSPTRSGTRPPAGDSHGATHSLLPVGFFPQMGWLGSGSDYTVFLDHLAVPAIDVGFKGGYGVYHSIYDDFNWMEKFGDPEFLTPRHGGPALYLDRHARRRGRGRAAQVRSLWPGTARTRRRASPDCTRSECERPIPPRRMSKRSSSGLSSLVEAVRRFRSRPTSLTGRPWHVCNRDVGGPRRSGEAERRARAGGKGVSARQGPARPPLVQAR